MYLALVATDADKMSDERAGWNVFTYLTKMTWNTKSYTESATLGKKDNCRELCYLRES